MSLRSVCLTLARTADRIARTAAERVDRGSPTGGAVGHDRGGQMSAASSPITTYFRVCDWVRVRYADTKADSDTTVLLLAAWPESLWAFRRIWGPIRPWAES
jgi:hypothetical protein